MAEELKKEQTTESAAAETTAAQEQTETTGKSKRPVILGCLGTGALILLLAVGAVHARDEKLALAKKAADIPIPVEVAAPAAAVETDGAEEEDTGIAEVETEEEADDVTADASAAVSAESEPAEVEAEAEGKVTEDTDVTNTAVLGSAEPESASELNLDAAAEETPGADPLAEESGEEEKGCIGDDGLVW